jgi:hypothetical protein
MVVFAWRVSLFGNRTKRPKLEPVHRCGRGRGEFRVRMVVLECRREVSSELHHVARCHVVEPDSLRAALGEEDLRSNPGERVPDASELDSQELREDRAVPEGVDRAGVQVAEDPDRGAELRESLGNGRAVGGARSQGEALQQGGLTRGAITGCADAVYGRETHEVVAAVLEDGDTQATRAEVVGAGVHGERQRLERWGFSAPREGQMRQREDQHLRLLTAGKLSRARSGPRDDRGPRRVRFRTPLLPVSASGDKPQAAGA